MPGPADPPPVDHASHPLPDPLRPSRDAALVPAPRSPGRSLRAGRPLGAVPDEPSDRRPPRTPASRRGNRLRFRTSVGPCHGPTPHVTRGSRPGPARGQRGNRSRSDCLRADEDVAPHRPTPDAGGSSGGVGKPRLQPGPEDGRPPSALPGSPMDGGFLAHVPGLRATDPIPGNRPRVSLPSVPASVPARGGPSSPITGTHPTGGVPSHPIGASPPRSARPRTVNRSSLRTESF